MPTLTLYRLSLSVFIFGLVVSGLTAFPLQHELSLLSSLMGIDDPSAFASYAGLKQWIAYVHFGLQQTYAHFPFMGYGTDWLAFGHLIIAVFFIGPFARPVENEWVLFCGLFACAAVLLLAFVCGPIRGIPLYWRLIDCSFGVFGSIPLLYCLWLTKKLRKEAPPKK